MNIHSLSIEKKKLLLGVFVFLFEQKKTRENILKTIDRHIYFLYVFYVYIYVYISFICDYCVLLLFLFFFFF
jgi:hypothetical protein